MRGLAVTAHNCLNCPSDELIRLSVAKPLSGAADREAPPHRLFHRPLRSCIIKPLRSKPNNYSSLLILLLQAL